MQASRPLWDTLWETRQFSAIKLAGCLLVPLKNALVFHDQLMEASWFSRIICKFWTDSIFRITQNHNHYHAYNIIRRESGAENNYTANQTYIDIQKSGALPFRMHPKLTLLFIGESCM